MSSPAHRTASRPAFALAALSLIWGYNWVVMKVALEDAGPLRFAAWRAVLGAVALFCVLLATRRPLAPRRGSSVIVLGVLQTTGFVGLIALALESGAVGKSAVLAYTMPFWTLLLAGLWLGERIRGLQWAAIGLAAAGLTAILSPWSGRFSAADTAYALGAAWCWAASMVVAKRMQVEDTDDLLNVSAWQMLTGAAGLLVLAWLVPSRPVHWTPAFSLALGYNVVLATSLAWLLWLFALSRLSAGVTGLATLATPVISIGAAWLELGEVPTRWEGGGTILILLALALLSASGWRRSRATPGD
jgi:drug/metabolite transporter (DMT)-like permease